MFSGLLWDDLIVGREVRLDELDGQGYAAGAHEKVRGLDRYLAGLGRVEDSLDFGDALFWMMTPALRVGVPGSSRSTLASRCPSVATMRAVTPLDSNSTPLRWKRVSSLQTENRVLSIISRKTTALTSENSASRWSGMRGKSRSGIPTRPEH